MRLIKLLLISIVVLFAMATMGGLLLPSHVLVSRATDVKSTPSVIFSNINNLNSWKQWMEGMEASNFIIETPVKGKLGNTAIRIDQITDSTIVTNWITSQGKVQRSTIRLIPDTSRNQTIVQWQFEEDIAWYPWERFSSIMNDKILGPMMEKNLQNLKNLAEKQP